MGRNFWSPLKKGIKAVEKFSHKAGESIAKEITHPFTKKGFGDFLDVERKKAREELPFEIAALGGGSLTSVVFKGEVIGGGLGDLEKGDLSKGLGKIIATQDKKLGKQIEKVGGKIEKLAKAERKTDEDVKELIKSEDKQNKTNNDTLKDFIKTNEEEGRHNTKVLNDELQALEEVEEKDEDLLGRIATKLDPPTNLQDFIKDLSEFASKKAKAEYLEENFGVFSALNNTEIQKILSVMG